MANIGDQLPSRFVVMVGNQQKQVSKAFVCIAGLWKELAGLFVNVGAVSKPVKVGGGRLGDVDNDGSISITDYTLIRLHYLGTRLLTADQFYRADVNQDGVVDEVDYALVRDYILAGGT